MTGDQCKMAGFRMPDCHSRSTRLHIDHQPSVIGLPASNLGHRPSPELLDPILRPLRPKGTDPMTPKTGLPLLRVIAPALTAVGLLSPIALAQDDLPKAEEVLSKYI